MPELMAASVQIPMELLDTVVYMAEAVDHQVLVVLEVMANTVLFELCGVKVEHIRTRLSMLFWAGRLHWIRHQRGTMRLQIQHFLMVIGPPQWLVDLQPLLDLSGR